MNREKQTQKSRWVASRSSIMLLIFLAVVALVFFSEHQGHLFGILPYLLLLACPFMHLFMHGSHGKHRDDVRGNH